MNRTYSESIINLSQVISHKDFFRIKLPGKHGFYIPHYNGHVFLEGEIVIFEQTSLGKPSIYIGTIDHMDTMGSYKLNCILRGKNRDPLRQVNWMLDRTICRKNILCELVKEQERVNGI